RFNSRSDVDSVPINVTAAMDHVTNVNTNLEFDPSVGCDVVIALSERALDVDGALPRLQGAVELNQESVTDGFDLGSVKTQKNFTQDLAMLLQQFQGKLVVTLRKRAVAHHVGKHDGRELALLDRTTHLLGSRQSFSKRGSPRRLSQSGSMRRSAGVSTGLAYEILSKRCTAAIAFSFSPK